MGNEETNIQDISIPRPTVMGLFRRWFFAGLLVTAPILLTVYITYLFINIIDGYAQDFLPVSLQPSTYIDFNIPGFGIVLGMIIIMLIGALTTGLLGRSLLRLGEAILGRLPVVRSVYSATKQIMETVMASQSDAFREVVLIQYPRPGLWSIGFVTGSTQGEVQNMSSENLINVFVPTTPNPTSGFLLFCPRKDAIPLDMGVEEAVKMVVSAGIVTPSDSQSNRTPIALSNPTSSKKAAKTSKKASAKKKTAAKTKTRSKSSAKKSAKAKG